MRILRISAAVFILLLGSAGFGQEAAQAPFVAVIGTDGVQRVEITGGSYYFNPNHIVVKVNVPVVLVVKKAGGATPHSIFLKAPEAGIDFAVNLKTEPTNISFTPTKVGTYPFWCTKRAPLSSKSHKDHGMTGVLEVVD
jgi:heme/copper-type cytochrome/quinol oxidase subunit 2